MLLLGAISLGAANLIQTEFSADPSQRLTHPVPVPESVVQILARDKIVAACMKDHQMSPGKSLASWFVGSEIHLNGTSEADMIVLPSSRSEERRVGKEC